MSYCPNDVWEQGPCECPRCTARDNREQAARERARERDYRRSLPQPPPPPPPSLGERNGHDVKRCSAEHPGPCWCKR